MSNIYMISAFENCRIKLDDKHNTKQAQSNTRSTQPSASVGVNDYEKRERCPQSGAVKEGFSEDMELDLVFKNLLVF